MNPFVNLSIMFWLQYQSNMSTNFLLYYTSGGISSRPAALPFLIFLSSLLCKLKNFQYYCTCQIVVSISQDQSGSQTHEGYSAVVGSFEVQNPWQNHLELLNCASCYQNTANLLTHLSIIIFKNMCFLYIYIYIIYIYIYIYYIYIYYIYIKRVRGGERKQHYRISWTKRVTCVFWHQNCNWSVWNHTKLFQKSICQIIFLFVFYFHKPFLLQLEEL